MKLFLYFDGKTAQKEYFLCSEGTVTIHLTVPLSRLLLHIYATHYILNNRKMFARARRAAAPLMVRETSSVCFLFETVKMGVLVLCLPVEMILCLFSHMINLTYSRIKRNLGGEGLSVHFPLSHRS